MGYFRGLILSLNLIIPVLVILTGLIRIEKGKSGKEKLNYKIIWRRVNGIEEMGLRSHI